MNDTDRDTPRPNAMDAGTDAAPPQTGPVASPGEMLREAREAQGRSTQELAEAAKLPQATIVALEADDFELLKEPVYVRGYYRKCALMLEADVDAIVAAYERKARPEAPALPDKIPVVAGGGAPLGRKLLRLLLILLLLAGLGAIAMWLLQTPLDEPLTQPSTSELFSPGSEADASAEAPAAATAAAPASEASPPDSVDRNEAATSESASAGDAQAEAVADGAPTAAATEGAQPAVLTLRFEEDSWLRVRNGEGRTVTNRLAEAGERARIADEPPPLELFVGYAPGTEARWRGEPVNFASATRSNNTALVTLE
ncbi:helix-turn-helix domain-containing protein [Algiphilus sp.]|uniref:helix-turn-helix domain-containing protein n=1 Tax=Algiphilus sp. TaxID=1872431 RepID=UPI003B51BE7B